MDRVVFSSRDSIERVGSCARAPFGEELSAIHVLFHLPPRRRRRRRSAINAAGDRGRGRKPNVPRRASATHSDSRMGGGRGRRRRFGRSLFASRGKEALLTCTEKSLLFRWDYSILAYATTSVSTRVRNTRKALEKSL